MIQNPASAPPTFSDLIADPARDAIQQARATFHQFIELAKAPHDAATVKLVLSDGKKAFGVWTDVLAVNSNAEFDVRPIVSMPTAAGQPQRRWTLRVEDIDDWQVRTRDGQVHGGFTMRPGRLG